LALLDEVPVKEGRLLLLGMGGGREAIHLAKLGFEVTGVDFIPEMIEKARENISRQELQIELLVQDVLKLHVPSEFYHIIWFSAFIYSFIPTREKRVQVLRDVLTALRPGGYSVCHFFLDTENTPSRKAELVRRLLAYITLGNLRYEKGDAILNNVGFAHVFPSHGELISELEESGFEIVYLHIPREVRRAAAVLRRKP
jgi:ubiquinone/menaquinone biosynthesis C-methylase UbiE